MLIISLTMSTLIAHSQGYISARIESQKSIPLEGVNIQIEDASLGTVSNQDGSFKLSLPTQMIHKNIIISHLGYDTKKVAINLVMNSDHQTIQLQEKVTLLNDINVYPGGFAVNILKLATDKGSANYAQSPFILKGFYRQLIKQDSIYVRLTDAFIEVFQPKYETDKKERAVKVIEARKSNDNIRDIDYFSPPSLLLNNIRAIGFSELFYKEHDLQISETVLNDMEVYAVLAIPKSDATIFLYETTFYIAKSDHTIIGYEAILPDRNRMRSIAQNINVKFKGKRIKVSARKIHEKGGTMNFIFEGKWFPRSINNEAQFEISDLKGNVLMIINDKASIIFYDLDNKEVSLANYHKGTTNYSNELSPTNSYDNQFWKENEVYQYTNLEERVRQDLEKKR